MSRNTMSFALPESMRDYIDTCVRDGSYGNTSEYLRELIRRNQKHQAAARLRDLMTEGLDSGPGRTVTDEVVAELHHRGLQRWVTSTSLCSLAETNLVERTRHHRSEGGDQLGERCFVAATAALEPIDRMPGAGSSSIGELCDVPGLRFRRVVGFPCGWFYFTASDHIDVVRLLADAQDPL